MVNKLFIDVETTGLNPFKNKLQLIGTILDDSGFTIIDPMGNVGIFKELLLDIKVLKVGHNINFDLLFLNLNGYRTVGPYFDTQIYFHFQNPLY